MLQDLRYAIRTLLKSPVFALTAIFTLALGIGANTAIFGLIDAVMLRNLPVPQPEQLVVFGDTRAAGSNGGQPEGSMDLYSYPMLRDLRKADRVFSGLAAMRSMGPHTYGRLQGRNERQAFDVELVSGNFFSVLGVKPWLGRLLMDEDDGAEGANPVVVASQSWWTRHMAGQVFAPNQTITLGTTTYTIVGVAPPEFQGIRMGDAPDFWMPLSMEAQISPGWNGREDRLFQAHYLFGRLKPGVLPAVASAETSVSLRRIVQDYAGQQPTAEDAARIKTVRVEVHSLATGLSRLRSRYSTPLNILMAVVGVVLAIACANIANLLMARSRVRAREISLRAALGASRWRLIRQTLSESLLLAGLGGVLGMLIGAWGSRLLLAFVSNGHNPIVMDVSPSGHVLLFTLGVSVCTALLFGVLPALSGSRANPQDALREMGRGVAGNSRNRLGKALIVAQISLSLVLLAGGALFLKSLANLTSVDMGFRADHLLQFGVDAGAIGYKEDATLGALHRNIEDRVNAIPGVKASSFSFFTYNQGGWHTSVQPQGVPADRVPKTTVSHNVVGPGYFAAMGIPLLGGRGFSALDAEKTPHVAVINETMARTFFPDGPALGRHFKRSGEEEDVEVVGISKDTRHEGISGQQRPSAYYPHPQHVQYMGNFVVRFEGSPAPIISAVRRAIGEVESNLPLSGPTTMEQELAWSMTSERLIARLSAFFAGLGVFLACLGIYGLMTQAVIQRTTEIGIRSALGAQSRQVVWLILRENVMLVIIGIAIGIPAVIGATRLVANQLYGVQANDPVPFLVASAVLAAVSTLAAGVPACRAARIDPVQALRGD
ncbi:MAG TPA: ABC transporter permease [Candidatus Limnocylindria bacterium]|jgi:predicted permease|nr:ABC transporter permease [Candidatus Limnocylindria bacterium]